MGSPHDIPRQASRWASSRLALLLVLLAAPAAAQDFDIAWWSVDGGGEVFSGGGDWQLSGTLGQWDGSESQDLTGGQWTLTGGFWPVTVDETDRLFRDGFES